MKAYSGVLLAIVIVVSLVAAQSASISISPASIVLTIADTTETLTITNTNDFNANLELNPSYSQTFTADGTLLTLTAIPGNTTVLAGGSTTLTISLTGDVLKPKFGDYPSVNFVINDVIGNIPVTDDVTVQFKRGFCDAGENGILNISITDIDIDNKGKSDDSEDETWILTDEIVVEVEIDNLQDNENLDDIIVELGMFNTAGTNFIKDLDFTSASSDDEEDKIGKIKDGDDKIATFGFRVPPDFATGSYRFVAKAYEDGKESVLCTEEEFSPKISVETENEDNRQIIVDEIILPSQVTCGETVTGEFGVFHIGDGDQDRIRITMSNNELGINQIFEDTNFDEGDEASFSFVFQVPSKAIDKTYNIEFRTEYEYDEGDYEEDSEPFIGFLKVIGCSVGGTPPPSTTNNLQISATLGSDAVADDELIINSIITNNGDQSMSITVDAVGYQSWAKLDSISQKVFTLNPGSSKTITFTLLVNDDVEGSQSFTIEASSNGNVVSQEVEVNIKGVSKGTGLGGFNFSFGNNNIVWIIAIINVILIVLIVVVAVRLSRR